MKIAKPVALGLVLLAARSSAAQIADSPSVKWATFSFQRALTESEQGKAALLTLNSIQAQKTREVEERAKALRAREEVLEQSLSTLSDQARAQQTKELDRFRLDTERFIDDARREVLGVQRDLETSFLATLRPVLETLIKDEHISVMITMDRDGLVWSDPAIDITSSVISQLARLAGDQR
jgi:Skp family chaperone for outer membrane proteins